MCTQGAQLTLIFNKKPHKTPLPSKRQVILECLFDSVSKRMKPAESKVKKYIIRIDQLLTAKVARVDEIMSIHGNLNFAANVAPFGRPFLATLSNLTIGRNKSDIVEIGKLASMGLRIWKKMLLSNRGLSYDFILGRLSRTNFDIFVDASEEYGIGGCCGNLYFKYS